MVLPFLGGRQPASNREYHGSAVAGGDAGGGHLFDTEMLEPEMPEPEMPEAEMPEAGISEADVLPEICGECGRRVEVSTEVIPVTIRDETVPVVGILHGRCAGCNRVYLDPEGTELLQRAAVAQLREARGLLTPADIQGLRSMLGLSQAGLEKLLGTGSKTVVRWEKGTVFQSVTADRLMRLLIAHPGLAAQLPGYERR